MAEHHVQRFERSPEVPRQAREFVAACLEGCPVRDEAVRAVGEVATDLLALDFYLEYEARVEIAGREVSCTVAGVPRYDCPPPELDAHTTDGYWPGTGPGRLLSIEAHEADDGTELAITWERRQPTPA